MWKMLKVKDKEYLEDLKYVHNLPGDSIADKGVIERKLSTYSNYAIMKMFYKMKKSLNLRNWLIIALTSANLMLIGLEIYLKYFKK